LIILIVLYAIILVCYSLADLPMKKIIAWYAIPVIFVLSLVGIMGGRCR
jgi:cobalt/nickel transport system permease protein